MGLLRRCFLGATSWPRLTGTPFSRFPSIASTAPILPRHHLGCVTWIIKKQLLTTCCITEIQKLFGESTPDGLEFQFRSIKKLGIAQKAAVEKGEDPSKLVVGNAGTGTPRASRVSAAITPGSRKRAATAKTPTSKRTQSKKAVGDSDDDSNEEDYDAKDVETPTHKKPKIEGQSTVVTPTPRKTASNGNAGSSFASAHTVTNSVNVADSFASAVGPPSTTSSLFGDGSRPSTSFTVPPPKATISSAFHGDDDDLVEIDSSQFSQSQTQSFSRRPPTKELEGQWQSSTTDLYSSRHDSNYGNNYTNSFISAPQANQSFYGEFELEDGEV